MSRSGYSDDCDDNWASICYRGAVVSAIRGKRGQAFLRELVAALDAMPEKRLIAEALVEGREACAIGVVGLARGVKMDDLDPEDPGPIAKRFGIATTLVREIEFENDDDFSYTVQETPEHRWARVRAWAMRQIVVEPTTA